ncbi:MAG: carboxypeptidase regulatory-like domain-containing protein [Nitrospirae bacterium]|nr:carboxypeptidase regulatory-like domain-containing protein [Nitrospirota bacterium]
MKKRRRISSMKPLWMAGFLVVLFSTIFTMAGCSNDSNKSVTNPNPATFEPKGTIQGVVRDTVTLQPIEGAVVDIGVAKTTTDATGQFVLRDVPATADALLGTEADTYLVTVDLRKAKSRENGVVVVDNADPSKKKYPEFVYTYKDVEYTSLNDSAPCPNWNEDPAQSGTTGYGYEDTGIGASNCGTNSTNHDTPVHKLSHSLLVNVGKLAASIEGQVAGCEGTPGFFSNVSGIYDVKIYSYDSSNNTGSGSSDHLVWAGLTDSTGKFTATNIEEQRDVKIVVSGPTTDTGSKQAFSESETRYETTKSDGVVLKLTNIQASNAIHVCSVDVHGPRIISVTPEPGSDLAAGPVSVEIQFSEPIAQNAFTGTTPEAVGNLYDYIEVYFDQAKVGNTAYTLSWNSTFDKLTVSIADAGISSLYHVRIRNINEVLFDESGLGVGEDEGEGFVDMGVCPDDGSAAASTWMTSPSPTSADSGSNDCLVYFSTKGSQTPVAPVLSLVNASSIDEANARTAVFDWPQASGAKTYKMYCRKVQKWGTTEQAHGYLEYSANVSGSSATIDFGSSDNAVTCDDVNNTGTCFDSNYACNYDSGCDYVDDEYDAFVENNEIQIAYDCYVVGVSADKTEGAKSNVVRVADTVGPKLVEDTSAVLGKLSCPSTGQVTSGIPTDIGTICDDPDNTDLITAIVLQYNEEVIEDGAETASNYTFENLATGGTGAVDTTSGAILYDPSTRLVLLPLSDPLNWITEVKGVGIPVMRTGADGILQTSIASGSDDVIPSYIATAGGVIATVAANTGPCVDYGTDATSDTTLSGDDVVVGTVIYAGPDGKCNSIANSANSSGDDIQVVPVGGYSGVCGVETGTDVVETGDDVDTAATSGFILTGANGVCDTAQAAYTAASATQTEPTGLSTGLSAGILPGPDGILQTTTPNAISDDELESASAGTAVKVQNVKDVAGNVIRTTGDEFTAGGEVK